MTDCQHCKAEEEFCTPKPESDFKEPMIIRLFAGDTLVAETQNPTLWARILSEIV